MSQIEITFNGFGKIPSPSPGPSGGSGTSGSFTPLPQLSPTAPERNTRWQQLDFSWLGYSWDDENEGNDVFIGQNEDAPAWVREVVSVCLQNKLIITDGTNTTKGEIEINASGVDGDNSVIRIKDRENTKEVTIDVPKDALDQPIDATWQEIDVCVGGVTKKMKILATAPYDPAP